VEARRCDSIAARWREARRCGSTGVKDIGYIYTCSLALKEKFEVS